MKLLVILFLINIEQIYLYIQAGADSDYRNVRTCEPFFVSEILLVKNRGNIG